MPMFYLGEDVLFRLSLLDLVERWTRDEHESLFYKLSLRQERRHDESKATDRGGRDKGTPRGEVTKREFRRLFQKHVVAGVHSFRRIKIKVQKEKCKTEHDSKTTRQYGMSTLRRSHGGGLPNLSNYGLDKNKINQAQRSTWRPWSRVVEGAQRSAEATTAITAGMNGT